MARWLISLGCRCVISDRIETLGPFLFFSNLKAVPRPAGPYPLANTMPPPPFPFSLSAASRVLLLTLIPNRCCHFCLASAPDYTTGVCHKNPLSPVSSTQHKDQLLQMKRDIRDFNNIAFSLSLSLFCCCCCHSLSLLPFRPAFAGNCNSFSAGTKAAYEFQVV